MGEDAAGELAHEGLTVAVALAGDDEKGVGEEVVETGEGEEKVGTRLDGGAKILHEGVA